MEQYQNGMTDLRDTLPLWKRKKKRGSENLNDAKGKLLLIIFILV